VCFKPFVNFYLHFGYRAICGLMIKWLLLAHFYTFWCQLTT